MPPQVAARMPAAMTNNTTTNPKAKTVGAVPASVPSSPASGINSSSKAKAAAASPQDRAAHGGKLKHKRRYCRVEGCERIVKSQGLCQRHGAKPRLCKIQGCSKQAQGNFDGMCKAHFKEHKRKTTPIASQTPATVAPTPEGSSVFDNVLPASVDFFPTHAPVMAQMPLVKHLREGFEGGKPPAWHRNEERKARGLLPIQNPATQLEGWERELVWMEILVLTGVPEISFRHLARAWGRDKGFHMVLAQFICERHGDVERKKRKREVEEAAAAANKAKKPALRRENIPPIDMKEIRAAMLSPEKKKQLQSYLRRRSSDSRKGEGVGDEDDPLVGADVWDDTCYGDANYNEALAADLFNLTAEDSALLMKRLSSKNHSRTTTDQPRDCDEDSYSTYTKPVMAQQGERPALPSINSSEAQQSQQAAAPGPGPETPPSVVAMKDSPPSDNEESLGPALAPENGQVGSNQNSQQLQPSNELQQPNQQQPQQFQQPNQQQPQQFQQPNQQQPQQHSVGYEQPPHFHDHDSGVMQQQQQQSYEFQQPQAPPAQNLQLQQGQGQDFQQPQMQDGSPSNVQQHDGQCQHSPNLQSQTVQDNLAFQQPRVQHHSSVNLQQQSNQYHQDGFQQTQQQQHIQQEQGMQYSRVERQISNNLQEQDSHLQQQTQMQDQQATGCQQQPHDLGTYYQQPVRQGQDQQFLQPQQQQQQQQQYNEQDQFQSFVGQQAQNMQPTGQAQSQVQHQQPPTQAFDMQYIPPPPQATLDHRHPSQHGQDVQYFEQTQPHDLVQQHPGHPQNLQDSQNAQVQPPVLHQRQHSQGGVHLHLLGQSSHPVGFQQQQQQYQQPSDEHPQSLHQRQPSSQGHFIHQSCSPFHPPVQPLQQAQNFELSYTNHATSNITQQQQVDTSHYDYNSQPLYQHQHKDHDGQRQAPHQEMNGEPSLHNYDHINEHLAADEDYHHDEKDTDESHRHHDYVGVEDVIHDHETEHKPLSSCQTTNEHTQSVVGQQEFLQNNSNQQQQQGQNVPLAPIAQQYVDGAPYAAAGTMTYGPTAAPVAAAPYAPDNTAQSQTLQAYEGEALFELPYTSGGAMTLSEQQQDVHNQHHNWTNGEAQSLPQDGSQQQQWAANQNRSQPQEWAVTEPTQNGNAGSPQQQWTVDQTSGGQPQEWAVIEPTQNGNAGSQQQQWTVDQTSGGQPQQWTIVPSQNGNGGSQQQQWAATETQTGDHSQQVQQQWTATATQVVDSNGAQAYHQQWAKTNTEINLADHVPRQWANVQAQTTNAALGEQQNWSTSQSQTIAQSGDKMQQWTTSEANLVDQNGVQGQQQSWVSAETFTQQQQNWAVPETQLVHQNGVHDQQQQQQNWTALDTQAVQNIAAIQDHQQQQDFSSLP